MSTMGRTKRSTFTTKLLHWEYWPTWVIYFPVFFYYLFLSIKARSFFFFSMTNPEMEMGGLYNCSKYKQLNHFPDTFKPITLFVPAGSPLPLVRSRIAEKKLEFPLIAKPDRGERGRGVVLLLDESQLEAYLLKSSVDFLVQEYIESTFEAGVFYYRFPEKTSGVIPSLVVKEFLTVTGDGLSSVKQLIYRLPRARLVADALLNNPAIDASEILPAGTKKILEPIGNHNRGTKFLDGNRLICPELQNFFDALSDQLPNFYYGRFDLKAPSEAAFKNAEGIKILEVNGVNAEPAHIYDPDARFFTGIRTLLRHWQLIYRISLQNNKLGFKPAKAGEAWAHFKAWKK